MADRTSVDAMTVFSQEMSNKKQGKPKPDERGAKRRDQPR